MYSSSYEFVGSAEFNFLYWTGFTRLIGSIAFSVSGRNREMAIPLSAGKKSQRSRLYYCRKTPSKRDLSFCLSSGKAKNPENPVDPV